LVRGGAAQNEHISIVGPYAACASLALSWWRALRDSNPCFRRERAMSYAARRRALKERRHIKTFARCGKEASIAAEGGVCLTTCRCSAWKPTVPWAAAGRLSVTTRSSACRASERKPSRRRAAAG